MADLTAKQLKFVDEYMVHGNASEAHKAAYGTDRGKNASYVVLHNKFVAAEIEKRLEARKALSWINEDMVLQGLYDEAVSHEKGSNSSSRISAWVWIGKHLGMWKEKKEEEKKQDITYNVISYNNSSITPEKEKKEIVVEEPKKIEGVEILDFNTN